VQYRENTHNIKPRIPDRHLNPLLFSIQEDGKYKAAILGPEYENSRLVIKEFH